MPAGGGSITARNSFSSGRHLRHLAGFPGQVGLAAGAVGRVLPGAHLLAEFVVEHLRAGPDLHGAAPVADFKDELPAHRNGACGWQVTGWHRQRFSRTARESSVKLPALGLVCPFHLVEAKETMAKPNKGNCLEIEFDCAQATEAAPAWAAEEGYEVTNYEQIDDAK